MPFMLTTVIFQRSEAQSFKYPETSTVDSADNYFGKKISDPYRWLENDSSAQKPRNWVIAENKVTHGLSVEDSFS